MIQYSLQLGNVFCPLIKMIAERFPERMRPYLLKSARRGGFS